VQGESPDESAPEHDAFAAFYRLYLPAVRGQVRLWVPRDEVDEIVASTFVTAWKKFDQIAPGSEKARLLGVARNHCRNRFRARRRSDALTQAVSHVVPPETVDLYAQGPDPAEFAPLLRALANLTPEEQDLLTLSIWQGSLTGRDREGARRPPGHDPRSTSPGAPPTRGGVRADARGGRDAMSRPDPSSCSAG